VNGRPRKGLGIGAGDGEAAKLGDVRPDALPQGDDLPIDAQIILGKDPPQRAQRAAERAAGVFVIGLRP
jgi:hypothetical protein